VDSLNHLTVYPSTTTTVLGISSRFEGSITEPASHLAPQREQLVASSSSLNVPLTIEACDLKLGTVRDAMRNAYSMIWRFCLKQNGSE